MHQLQIFLINVLNTCNSLLWLNWKKKEREYSVQTFLQAISFFTQNCDYSYYYQLFRISRKEERMEWSDVQTKGGREGQKQGQKEEWTKWNLDCLLDKMLVLTQKTDIVESSSSNIIQVRDRSLDLLNCILQKTNNFFLSPFEH